jgi:hypothetical protein
MAGLPDDQGVRRYKTQLAATQAIKGKQLEVVHSLFFFLPVFSTTRLTSLLQICALCLVERSKTPLPENLAHHYKVHGYPKAVVEDD